MSKDLDDARSASDQNHVLISLGVHFTDLCKDAHVVQVILIHM